MLRKFLAATALLATLAASAAATVPLYPEGWTPIGVDKWGGLNLLTDSTMIDGDAQSATNVLTDSGFLEKRPGNVLLTTILAGSPVTYVGDWVAPSGTRYLIAQSSNTIYQTNFSGAAVAVSTITSGSRISIVPAFSKLLFADAYRPIWYWNENSTGTVTDAASGSVSPICTYLTFDNNRVYCGNLPSEGSSRVRVSSYGGAGYFTVPSDVASVDQAANVFDFNSNDGDYINCMAATPFGVFVGKRFSSYMLKGTGNLTYTIRTVDPKIGCVDNRSVQMVYGVLQWLAVDGVYAFDGAGPPKIISRDLDPLIKNVREGTATNGQWATQFQADWATGSSSAGALWDFNTSPGSIFPSSNTFVDNSTGTFILGTSSAAGYSPSYSPSSIQFATPYSPFVAASVVTSTYIARYDAILLPELSTPIWTQNATGGSASVSGGTLTLSGFNQYLLDFSSSANANHTFTLVAKAVGSGNVNSSFLVKSTNSANFAQIIFSTYNTVYVNGSFSQLHGDAAVSFSTYTIFVDTGGGVAYWRDGIFITSATALQMDINNLRGGNLPMQVEMRTLGLTTMITHAYVSDTVAGSMGAKFNIPTVSTFTSRIFDTTYTLPIPGPITSTATVPSGTSISYSVRCTTSPNNDLWTAFETVTIGSVPTTINKRYVQYKVNFTQSNLVDSPGLTGFNWNLVSSGYYYSKVNFIGTAITSWSQFSVTENNPGTYGYAVRTATYSFPATNTNLAWTSQTANQNIGLAVSTPTYAQFRLDSTGLTNASNAEPIRSVFLRWAEGANIPVASATLDRRYFLCVAISTAATAPDTCLLRQKNGKWVFWTGPSVGAMGIYNYNIVAADGGTSSKVWKIMQPGVYQDDGSPIAASWVSGDYTGGAIFNNKVLHEMWVDADPVQGSSVTLSYQTEKLNSYVDSQFSLDNGQALLSPNYFQTNSQFGVINKWVPPAAGYDTGKYINIKFSDNQLNDYFRINTYLLYIETLGRSVP